MNPSFSEHGYPHASPPVTEPAQGAPCAIREQPPTEFVRTSNHVANPPRNEAARWVRPYPKNSGADQAIKQSSNQAINRPTDEALKAREAVRVSWQACLPESVRGEACACKNSREGGVHTSVALASTVLLGCQKRGNCTLGQLMSPRSESVFFASFLCRFGQRNDAPPRAVANSDKEISSLKQTTNAKSSNPALTPTANPGTWHPSINPDPGHPKPRVRTKNP